MRAALADISRKAAHFAGAAPGDSVLDIGCNDGTLLRSYSQDVSAASDSSPPKISACEAAASTDRIVPDFFSARPSPANSFASSLPSPCSTTWKIPIRLSRMSQAFCWKKASGSSRCITCRLVLDHNAFDAICHEHLEYYSLSSLEPLLARHGYWSPTSRPTMLTAAAFGSTSCIAIRRRFRFRAPRTRGRDARPGKIRRTRPRRHLSGIRRACAARSESSCRVGCADERRRGQEISVYGASTKGNTLLQVFGIDHTLIRSAAERNPEKWGRYTVGTWIPIVSEAEARVHADDFLVLPWHFMAEIQIRERDFLARGGKLMAPLPNLRVISSNHKARSPDCRDRTGSRPRSPSPQPETHLSGAKPACHIFGAKNAQASLGFSRARRCISLALACRFSGPLRALRKVMLTHGPPTAPLSELGFLL